jgi:hypothetical protein
LERSLEVDTLAKRITRTCLAFIDVNTIHHRRSIGSESGGTIATLKPSDHIDAWAMKTAHVSRSVALDTFIDVYASMSPVPTSTVSIWAVSTDVGSRKVGTFDQRGAHVRRMKTFVYIDTVSHIESRVRNYLRSKPISTIASTLE